MPDAFDAALRVLFANPDGTTPATYLAAENAPPVAVRAIVTTPSDAVQGNPLGRVVADSVAVQLLVADVPVKPDNGARLVLRGRTYRLSDVTRDKDGRLWRAVLSGGTGGDG